MSYPQASSSYTTGESQDVRPAPADFNAWQHMTRTVAHYERLEQIGEGTYGQVYRARCIDTGGIVALKKMRIHHGGYWGMPLQLIREIKILKRLQHPNLLQMIEVVTSKGVEYLDNDDPPAKNHQVKDKVADARESYKGNLFLVLEYVEHDLTGLLDVAYQFTPVQIKCIFKQLLEALAFMHQNKYVHRDIKSSNLLLDSNFTLKLADFGLARSIEAPLFDQVQERKANFMSGPEFTNKVITLWYRPPEILLGAVQYGPAVDVWSAGCILAELILGKPLFAAKTELDQLTMILEMLGPPPSEETYEFFESGMKKDTSKVPLSLSRNQKPPGKLRPKYNEKMPPAALGLIEKMLAWDPRQRVTASNALKHRYFWTEPVAPANPAELNESLKLGPNGHFHEFQTKKKRKQAKAVADEAKEKARLKGATEEEAQAVHEKTYRKLIKKVFDEGLGANEGMASGSAQPTPADRPPTLDDSESRRGERKERRRRSLERSSSRGRHDEEDTRRRDTGSRDRHDDETKQKSSRESRRSRESESGRKRRRDDLDDTRRSRRSRDRRSREDDEGEGRRRDEPCAVVMQDDPSRNGDTERYRETRSSRDRDVFPDDRPGREMPPSDAGDRFSRSDRDHRHDRDDGDYFRDRPPKDRPPFPESDRPRDRPPFDDPDFRDRPRHEDRERFRDVDDRGRPGPPDGRGRERPPDRPSFDDRGPPDGRGRDWPPGRPPFEDHRPPFDDRGPPDGRDRDRPPDRPPFDDRRPPVGRSRDRPPFDDRGPPDGRGRGRPLDRPQYDDRRPPFDDRGPPGRDRPMDRPPFDDRGPPGRDRPMDRPPFDDRGPPERERLMDRPPFDGRGPPDGRGRGRPMDRPAFDDRGPPGGRDRPMDGPPFDDRRRMRDRGPADWEGPGGDLHPDDRESRRMGPPMDDRDRRREPGFPDDRERLADMPPPMDDRDIPRDRPPPQFDDFDRARRPPPREDRGRYGPSSFDEEDRYRRPDRPPFPNEPGRPDEIDSRTDRPDSGSRRDKSDRRSGDSHRRRKKDKKRRDRSRSRGRHDESRRNRSRDDRRRNDTNPDYYGPPHGQEGDRRRDDRDRHEERREKHRDRDRGRNEEHGRR